MDSKPQGSQADLTALPSGAECRGGPHTDFGKNTSSNPHSQPHCPWVHVGEYSPVPLCPLPPAAVQSERICETESLLCLEFLF